MYEHDARIEAEIAGLQRRAEVAEHERDLLCGTLRAHEAMLGESSAQFKAARDRAEAAEKRLEKIEGALRDLRGCDGDQRLPAQGLCNARRDATGGRMMDRDDRMSTRWLEEGPNAPDDQDLEEENAALLARAEAAEKMRDRFRELLGFLVGDVDRLRATGDDLPLLATMEDARVALAVLGETPQEDK